MVIDMKLSIYIVYVVAKYLHLVMSWAKDVNRRECAVRTGNHLLGQSRPQNPYVGSGDELL